MKERVAGKAQMHHEITPVTNRGFQTAESGLACPKQKSCRYIHCPKGVPDNL